MIININSISYNLIIDESKLDGNLIPVIFLHGFTGRAEDWNFIIDKLPGGYLPIALDLIGHGKTDHPDELDFYSTASQINHLKQIVAKLNLQNVILCGYSMGGRLAVSFTVEFPGMVRNLILESTTPGIANETERTERVKNDHSLADKIEKEGVNKFVSYWMNIPLFETLKKLPVEKYKSVFNNKLNNHSVGLANSLRGFGTGKMPHNWERIKNLTQNILLITGELDKKFCEINKRLNSILPNSNHAVIPSCGHNVHLENPEEFTILVNQFLIK